MTKSVRKPAYPLLVIYCYLPVLFCLCYCVACKNYPAKDEHPEYFTAILKKIDTITDDRKDEAIAYLDSAFYAFPHPGILDYYNVYDFKRGYWYYVKKNYEKAILYSDSMLQTVENKDDKKFAVYYAKALFYKGDNYYKLKIYNEAFHWYSLARSTVINKVKDRCLLPEYNSYIGYLLYKQGKFLPAAGYFLQDYEEQSGCSKRDMARFIIMQRNLTNAGLCYQQSGMRDSALYYYNRALDYITSNEHNFPEHYTFIKLAKSVIYGDQARILDDKKDYPAAEILFKKSIDGTQSSDQPYALSVKTDLAASYIKAGKQKEAGALLKDIRTALDTSQNEDVLINWYKLSNDYYEKTGNISMAHTFLQTYVRVKDSIVERDKQFMASNISRDFETAGQRQINETLQKENYLKTIYLTAALIVSAMAIGMILLIGQNLQRSGKHVRQLQKLNSEVQHKNEDLQRTLVSLEQSHHENSRIMRIVAHDLKNPISAINNLIYALLKKDYPADLKEVFELIKTACGNSMALIRDVLHDRKEPTVIRKELVDMKRLMEYCVDLLQTKADEKSQQLTLQAEDAILMLNRQKMWRVVSNIVNNAIKFSPEHTVINIKLQRKEDAVLLSVHDKGIGIPPELKDQIFTLSPEASRPGTIGEESHGLGLSISRKIIEEHQGSIWFDSIVGKGSVFYVELPFL